MIIQQFLLVRRNTKEDLKIRLLHWTLQMIGKRKPYYSKKNHFERVCRQKFRWNTGHGESLNHLTVSSSNSWSESDSDIEVFPIPALLPDVSDNQKGFVEKNEVNEPLVQQTDNDKHITQQTDTDESVLLDNSPALVQTLPVFKRDLALEEISVRFLIDSGSAINIKNLETFNWIKKKNRNLFLKQTKTKILTYGAKNVSSLQMKCTCQLTLETGTKITTALLYVIDSNSHNLLTGYVCYWARFDLFTSYKIWQT